LTVDATITQVDPNAYSIALFGTPGGTHTATFDCEIGSTISGSLNLLIAAVTVNKVAGDAPADATFPVTVTCNTAAGGGAPSEPEGAAASCPTPLSFDATGAASTSSPTPRRAADQRGRRRRRPERDDRFEDCGDGRTTGRGGWARRRLRDLRSHRLHPDHHQRLRRTCGQPADVVQQQPAFTG
jgi:hypothetical protein